ncbi:MAG: UDP-N-acetylglucosamine 2-epimerase (hydrolyzing) [Candidatus Aenigmatarchaeota archaeon]|nr:MAG: UDP-N-acetylglucosamine 2-epimerase (hydrolyzing) [Candidatus Aenigmarchaeota archaeon]
MRKVCVVTGTRAEYGLLKPVMEEIKKSENLRLYLIVTGMHLSKEFGYTKNEIIKDGFKIDSEFRMNPPKDTPASMSISIGKGIVKFSESFSLIKPDIVLVLGDRIEPLAATIASSYMNIPIAHIHGGDVSEGLDESARHAITKFAHMHFPATKKSAERISKMGEEKWRIFVVGAPCLDTILEIKFPKRKYIENKFDIDPDKPLILVLQHSVTTEPEKAGEQIIETLEAIKKLGEQTIIIYPNSDAGGREIIKQIKKYEKLSFLSVYKSIDHKDYLSLLKYASVLVGNSSCGIVESPAFKIPVVNIGTRQDGRERSTNVIDVGHDRNVISTKIKKTIYDKKFIKGVKKCKTPYGHGNASKRIVKILSDMKIDKNLLQKKMTY